MSVNVLKIATPLRKFAGGQAELAYPAMSVMELLESAVAAHPLLKERLFSADGELHKFVAVYVGSRNVRSSGGLATLLTGEPVSLVVAVAGG